MVFFGTLPDQIICPVFNERPLQRADYCISGVSQGETGTKHE